MGNIGKGIVLGALTGAGAGLVWGLVRNGTARDVVGTVRAEGPEVTQRALEMSRSAAGSVLAAAPGVLRDLAEAAGGSGLADQVKRTVVERPRTVSSSNRSGGGSGGNGAHAAPAVSEDRPPVVGSVSKDHEPAGDPAEGGGASATTGKGRPDRSEGGRPDRPDRPRGRTSPRRKEAQQDGPSTPTEGAQP